MLVCQYIFFFPDQDFVMVTRRIRRRAGPSTQSLPPTTTALTLPLSAISLPPSCFCSRGWMFSSSVLLVSKTIVPLNFFFKEGFRQLLLKKFVLLLMHLLHLGILLLLQGLLLREFLLQDQRVLHLLHQDQGSGPPHTDSCLGCFEGYPLQGKSNAQKEGRKFLTPSQLGMPILG